MHLAYCDESADERVTACSAIVVPDRTWRAAFDQWREFRQSLRDRYGIPIAYELHARRLMAGQGMPGTRTKPLGRDLGCRIFNEAIDAVNQLSAQGIYGINVSLRNSKFRHPLREAVERLFQRFENNLGHVRQHGLIIYDGTEAQSRTMVRHILRRMQVFNLIPSMLYHGTSRAMPVVRILGDPAIRNASDDVFLQMADVMAYALLRKDCPPKHPILVAYGIKNAFDRLDKIFLTVAHRPDPQGVVRA